MKKIISTLFVAVCLFATIPVHAQLQWGLKAGLNLSKADFSGLDKNFKAENMKGFFVGPMVEFTIPIGGLGIDAALLYSQKGTKIRNEETREDVTNKQHALEIPVNLKYSFGLGTLAGVYLAAGPSFSFNLSDDDWGRDLAHISADVASKDLPSMGRRSADVGINVGAGVKLINHLQIGFNYNIPLTDSAKKNFSGDKHSAIDQIFDGNVFKSKNKMWQVSIAYMF